MIQFLAWVIKCAQARQEVRILQLLQKAYTLHSATRLFCLSYLSRHHRENFGTPSQRTSSKSSSIREMLLWQGSVTTIERISVQWGRFVALQVHSKDNNMNFYLGTTQTCRDLKRASFVEEFLKYRNICPIVGCTTFMRYSTASKPYKTIVWKSVFKNLRLSCITLLGGINTIGFLNTDFVAARLHWIRFLTH